MSEDHKCTGGGAGDGHEHDITCREISEFLLAYVERDLDGEQRAEFERHLNLCPPCVHYLDGYRETIDLVRRCVQDEGSRSLSGTGSVACETSAAERSKYKPPEGLIQAILAAKRSTERG